MPEPAIVLISIFGVLVAVFFIVAIVLLIRHAKANATHRQTIEQYNAERVMTDGNGRTEHQRDYLSRLKSQLSYKEYSHETAISKSKSHSHSGKAEHYDPIVGSLGKVSDEGCDELDGVRLVEHDESYCDDASHFEITDYDNLKQAIVLGEIVNSPRFKKPFRRSSKR